VIKDGIFSVRQGLLHTQAQIKLDPAKTPGAIDLTILEGKLKGEIVHGIYKLERRGDVDYLTICHADPGEERPKTFVSGPDSGLYLMVYRREVVSAAPKKAVKPPTGAAPAHSAWEYRILTKDELLELGKKDIEEGIFHMGRQGFQLAGIEPGKTALAPTFFYFQRPTNPAAAKGDPKTPPLEELNLAVTVLSLKHADGAQLVRTLQEILEGKDNPHLRLSVDPRTNSILVRGSELQVELIEALVVRLDVPLEKTKAGKSSKDSGADAKSDAKAKDSKSKEVKTKDSKTKGNGKDTKDNKDDDGKDSGN
jgi:hypothetical protein